MRHRYHEINVPITPRDSVMVLQVSPSQPRRSVLARLAYAIGNFYVAARLTWGVYVNYRRLEKSLVAAKSRPYKERSLLSLKTSQRPH